MDDSKPTPIRDPDPAIAGTRPHIRAGDGRGRILDVVHQIHAVQERHAIRLSNIEHSLQELHLGHTKLAAKVSVWSGLLALIGALLARLL